jgi:hypothetical protein
MFSAIQLYEVTSRGVITVSFMSEQFSLEVSHRSDTPATTDIMRDARSRIRNPEEGISKQSYYFASFMFYEQDGE